MGGQTDDWNAQFELHFGVRARERERERRRGGRGRHQHNGIVASKRWTARRWGGAEDATSYKCRSYVRVKRGSLGADSKWARPLQETIHFTDMIAIRMDIKSPLSAHALPVRGDPTLLFLAVSRPA